MSAPAASTLTPRRRASIAIVIAIVAGTLSWALASRPGFSGDFLAWWFGARVLLAGGDPYVVGPSVAPWFVNDRLFYPLTAVVATLPLARLPLAVAQGLFFGAGSGVLAWVAMRDGVSRLPLFLSFPFVLAANLGHWSPWIAAALLWPALGWLVAVKPNLAVAVVVARPSKGVLVGSAAFVLATALLWPWWPMAWLGAMREAPHHPVPLLTALGAPLVLAALGWREWEGRLLLAMALLPQTMTFADQLVLMLVPRERKEVMLVSMASLLGGLLWMRALGASPGAPSPTVGTAYVVCGVYWPALAVVVRRWWVKRRAAPPA